MADYHPVKLKRKDLDGVNDDFSEFSLSSPARKIRRLDADLPPIIEEAELDVPLQFEQQSVSGFGASGGAEARVSGPVIEELPSGAENEERAIVLFKPMNTPLFHSPSNFIVDSNLISSIKGQALWGTNSNSSGPVEDEETKADERLSVIPWVPCQQFHQRLPLEASEKEASEPMDAEETGAPMETGDNAANSGVESVGYHIDTSGSVESLQPWWQRQLCVIPQPLQNTITPITWYR